MRRKKLSLPAQIKRDYHADWWHTIRLTNLGEAMMHLEDCSAAFEFYLVDMVSFSTVLEKNSAHYQITMSWHSR